MPNNKKLDQLTGWRFVAAFGILVCHFNRLLFPNSPKNLTLFWEGLANFVGFFFVLSGFILAYNYQSKFLDGTATIRSFLVARFARIYPALIFSLLVALPAFLFINYKLHAPLKELGTYSVASILLIKTWLPFANWRDISAWNGPTWSIETEFFFYLCFPFMIRPLSRLKLGNNVAVWVVISIAMIAINGFYDLASHGQGEPFFGAFELLHSSPYFCLLEFIFGIVTYNIARELPEQTLLALRKSAAWALPVLFVLYAAFNILLPTMSRFHGLPGIVFSLVILISYTSPPLLNFLQTPKLIYLGEISFSLYLLHIPVFNIFSYFGKILKPIEAIKVHLPPLYGLMVIGTTFLLAAFCMKYIEDPWRRKLRNRLSPRS